MMQSSEKKAGFVVLAGRSNVGKSTLLNALVGSKIAIVTPKPQTTRRPVRGIVNDPRGQIVFVDTPGVFLGKKDALSRRLNQIVGEQLDGIDAIVYVIDPTRAPGPEEERIQRLLRSLPTPIIAVINKSDLDVRHKPFLPQAQQANVGQKMTLALSALKRRDLNRLVDALFDLLPTGEAFYPETQQTDLRHGDWIAELIREKIFLQLEQELPYSIHVEVTEVNQRPNRSRYIAATIWTNQERYKGMIIGAGGQRLKKIGTAVRQELEAIGAGDKTFVELQVGVDPKWQNNF